MKFTKEEIDIIEKFLKYRGTLWMEAVKDSPWDTLQLVDPKTLEHIRVGFITGVWYCTKEEYNNETK